MEAIDNAWAEYYTELDPVERLKLFNALADTGSSLDEFRRELYQERYHDPRQPERKVDTWLWKLVYLPGIYRKRRLFARPLLHEMEGTLRDLHLDRPEALTEEQKTVLYHEYRNAARRYLATCNGARYGSKLFGMKKATDQEQRDRACEDVWQASRGVALASGLEKELTLWCDALRDTLREFDPDSETHYKTLEQNFQK